MTNSKKGGGAANSSLKVVFKYIERGLTDWLICGRGDLFFLNKNDEDSFLLLINILIIIIF